jgi:hypothetical protein
MSGETKPDLLEAYAEYCRKLGAVCPVGPERYRRFIEMSDDVMEGLLCLLIANSAKWIEQRIADEATKFCVQDIEDSLETQLHLVALGFLRFGESGEQLCFQPEGPPPTETENNEIELRILSSRALVLAARERVFRLFPSPRN